MLLLRICAVVDYQTDDVNLVDIINAADENFKAISQLEFSVKSCTSYVMSESIGLNSEQKMFMVL